MQKFVQRSRIRIFHNERAWSTQLDPNLMFGTFWTISLLHELPCKMGRPSAINVQVRAPKSRRNFSQRTCPIHPMGPQTNVWRFQTISLLHELPCKTGRTSAINAQVRAMKSCRNFSLRTHPIHPIGPQTHILGCFRPFRYCTNFSAKHVELVRLMHKFVQWSGVRFFHNERTRSTIFDPKPMFWRVSECSVTTRSLV
jgi:hypothetical protein